MHIGSARHLRGYSGLRIGSALVHGIYSTDPQELSAPASFQRISDSDSEDEDEEAWSAAFYSHHGKEEEEQYELGRTLETTNEVSVYSFRDGIDSSTKALEEHLRSKLNVSILVDTTILKIKMLQILEVRTFVLGVDVTLKRIH